MHGTSRGGGAAGGRGGAGARVSRVSRVASARARGESRAAGSRRAATGWRVARSRARVRPRPRVWCVRLMPYRGAQAGPGGWCVVGGHRALCLTRMSQAHRTSSQVATPCCLLYAVPYRTRNVSRTALSHASATVPLPATALSINLFSMSNYESLKNPHARRVGVNCTPRCHHLSLTHVRNSRLMTHETCEAMAEACFRFRSGFSHGHRSASLPPPTVSSPLGRSGPRETGSGPGLRRASSPRSSCRRCCG